ncbi:MAG: radical SAM protein [Elusimicrobia bacterium]|nr:radical SAM protein [Elusimicrobiota bacterium]
MAKVYVEPTSRCNLSCRTCIRQTWDEPQGDMSAAVFGKLIESLRRFPHLESVMLGGFGEPTVHPDIIRIVGELKALKVRVEMVSNGTLLDDQMIAGLRESRLDRLWVSFDGTDGSSFEHVRKGASFEGVFRSLRQLRELNRKVGHQIKVGLAVVVMRDNISDLKGIGKLARQIGADRISVSNVIPYSPEMDQQMICGLALTLGTFASIPDKLEIDLPRIDAGESTKEVLLHLLTGGESLSMMGNTISAPVDECRFIRDRCCVIRWDGEIAPCMGLLHDHTTYFRGYERKNQHHSFGNLARRDLWDIWNATDYAAFRDKVATFDFSPCHICGGCDLIDANKADCGGNKFPTACGGCLWAQGIIQCP